MFTTEGECSTGLSIGPICNSMARVSRNSSASGISFHLKRGVPMSTVNSPSAPFQQLRMPAVVSNVSALLPVSSDTSDGHAAHAVAAGAGFRAVIVVDADEGVGAGRARRIERHQLIVRRAACGGGRARLIGADLGRARAQIDHDDLVADAVHLHEGLVGERAHKFGRPAFARLSPGLYGE